MEFKEVTGGVCAAKGFQAAGVHCGFRANPNKKDLALIVADVRCTAAGMYTSNKVKGAPITVDKAHLTDGHAQAILVNSGNANTCAANGIDLANECCRLAAGALGLKEEDILPSSTGVIGQPMTIDPFAKGIPEAAAQLAGGEAGSTAAAQAIMTTDTYPKQYALQFTLGGKTCTLGAIGKGSGMIAPNLATLLTFYTTDAAISAEMLDKAIHQVVPATYNQLSVDLDTSTNDTVLLLANGMAGNEEITEKNEDYETFCRALNYVNETLAKRMAGDGEGCTALFEVKVVGALDKEQAVTLAKSVITSNLTKAAIFGHDANWGRILCAMGYSGAQFDPERVDLYFESAAGRLKIIQDGVALNYSEAEATKILSEPEVTAIADVKMGDAEATAWGCDLTFDYVKINADYRS